MKKICCLLAIITITIVLNSCQKFEAINFSKHSSSIEKTADANVAIDWYKLQLRIMLERNSALNMAKSIGYVGIGLYESVRYASDNSLSLSTKLYQMPVMPAIENNKTYNWEESANAALAGMVRSFYTGLTPANMTSIDSLENAYNAKVSSHTTSEVFNRSQSFGKSIASAIYNWSLTDNYNPSGAGYVPPVFPGAWVPTPPLYVSAINTYVGNARTFLTIDSSGVPPAPIAYSEEVNSDFYKMAKHLYDISQTLTPEQKNTALYWVDQGNGIGYTPDGHNMLVATEAIEQAHVSLSTAAEAFAKAGIAERESNVQGFRAKYYYNLLRPVTYIRKVIDTAWLSFIPTPPFPEYPAAHAYVTGAVMQAVARVLGPQAKVTDYAYVFRGVPARSYSSLFAVGEEAGISRLYGGIHYLPSVDEGLLLAKEWGNRVGNINLHAYNH